MGSKFLVYMVLIMSTFFVASCGFTHPSGGNVLVLAIDRLRMNDVLCNKELRAGQKSGFEMLCKSSVRFTHAFTTSLLSLPAMASLLTGLYPFQHKVRDNGQNFLSAQILTTPEIAYQKGYSTSFFTGGAPILRSSGLQQGFALFDDSVAITPRKLFRPAIETFHSFLSWAKDQDAPFFSVIYVPDLLFKNKETQNEFGEARNLSFESQLDEFDNALYLLLSELKKNHLWDKTNIVLTGLSGRPSAERNSIGALDLHSEQTQVALLIKPQGKPRDEGLSWTFDDNVSLADIGATLLELIGEKYKSPQGPLPIISVFNALNRPNFPSTSERWILSESLWGPWRNMGPAVYALRKENLLFIQNDKQKFFNTLIDKMEVSSTPKEDPQIKGIHTELSEILTELDFKRPEHEDKNFNESAKIFNFDMWTKKGQTPQRIQALAEDISFGPMLDSQTLLARELIQTNNWNGLFELGKKYKNLDWQALANRNLNRDKGNFKNPCLYIIDKKLWSDASKMVCKNNAVGTLIDELAFESEKDPTIKESHKKKLLLVWKEESVFDKIIEANWGLELIWNLAPSKIEDNNIFKLALYHPYAQKIHAQLLKEIPKD